VVETHGSIRCPECGSERLYKAGLRYLENGTTVQRWLCRDCGLRFSCDPFNVSERVSTVDGHPLNRAAAYSSTRQVCDLAEESKNLAISGTRQEQAQREGTKQVELQGKIVEYAWKMKKRGQAESTIQSRTYRLNVLVRKGADLMNPESFETVLATEPWTPANKRFFVNTYISFAKAFSIPWTPIKTSCERKEVFIPLEKELDALISGCGPKTATLLQVLKTTGARIGETAKLKWTDINMENSTIAINSPEKGSRARTIKVSPKTVAMLNALPKRSPYVFNAKSSQTPPKTRNLQGPFMRSRNRLARQLQNPRLKQIHFHTFRHWFATMLYQRTKDILYVKQQLGHKRIENTEIYTHLINFESDEYHVAHAKTLEEDDKLIEAGFEYVRYNEKDQVAIYRKRK